MNDIFDIDYVKKLTSEGKEDEVFNYSLRLAEEGNIAAQNYIGYCYFNGCGVGKKDIKAVEWYTKAAERNDPDAMLALGDIYESFPCIGVDLMQCEAKAAEWYKKAAELGNSTAMKKIADCYYNGDGIAKSYKEAFGWYLQAAELGERDAMCSLGICYEFGQGVTQNKEAAASCYRRSAELGNVDAMFCLGDCYEWGIGVPCDGVEAVKWYTIGAEHGSSKAMLALGKFYRKHWSEEPFKSGGSKKIIEWYTKAAESGSDKAMVELADCYMEGSYVNKDIDKAVELYMKAADLENGRAMKKLATFYEKGIGVSKSLDNAAYWYKKSAKTGDNDAMFRYGILRLDSSGIQDDYLSSAGIDDYISSALSGKVDFNYNVAFSLFAVATCHANGIGVDFDPFRAEELYKRAVDHFKEGSDKKISLASFALAVCFEIGRGVPLSMRKAVKYYKKSVYNDNAPCPNAQYKLACLYFDGKGVRKNYHKAVQLFLKAAEQGHPEAQYRAAECYADGIGTARNTDKASYWYIKAAANGHDKALYKAGEFFEYGIGTEADNIAAIAYYRRAVAKGVKEAEKHLKELERVSCLNAELEERISKLTDQLKEKEYELAAEYEKQKNGIQMAGIESQMLEIKQMMISNFNDLRAVSNDTNRVVKDTNSRVGEIQSQLSSLSDYLEKDLPNVLKEKRRESGCDSLTTINTDELSEDDEKKVGSFCSSVRRIIENQIREKNDLIRRSHDELKKRMGRIWDEFSTDTQNSLASALTLLEAYRNINDEHFDFSSIGILATSALENELRRVFFIDFRKFALEKAKRDIKEMLNKSDLPSSNEHTHAAESDTLFFNQRVINKLPKKLKYYDAKNSRWILSDPEHFSLGQLPYIFGQKGMKENDMEDIERLNDYREAYLKTIVDQNIKKEKNLSCYSEYFTKAIFSDSSKVPEKNWMCYCPGSLIFEVEAVRNLRNKSAHAGGLKREEAECCCTKIIGSEPAVDSRDNFDEVVGILEKLYILLGKRK